MDILYSLFTMLKFSISISVLYICIYIIVRSGLFVCFLRDIRKATWLIVQPTVSRSGREVGLGKGLLVMQLSQRACLRRDGEILPKAGGTPTKVSLGE